MKKLVEWLDVNHLAVMFALTVMVVASVYMYLDLPKDVFPRGDFPRFQIIADIGFAALDETEINLTRPIEEAVKTAPNVVEVRSVTERGTATIDIYLKWGTDLDQAFQQVQSRINQVRGALPGDAAIDVIRMTTSAYPMSEYGIWSDTYDLKQLYTTVRYSIVPKLIGIEGIYGLDVVGGEEPEIRVSYDPRKLIASCLDPAAAGDAIDQANKISFIGNVYQNTKAVFVIGGEKFADLNRIGETVVATRMGQPVYLRDVARVEDSCAEVRRIVSINGHRGLFIDVQKQQDADGLIVSRKLDEKMAEIEKEYGGRLHIAKWDLSDFVRSSIRGILFDIFIAVAIILFIVYYVMNRLRYSLPIILVLPLVILSEFLVLKLLGLTVNIMTLGGMSAAIGIIADNAIVVTENFVRFKTEVRSPDPLSSSLADIVPIMVWATMVSIIVFLPLYVLSGVSGLFFKPLAATLATTIIISLFMAVVVIPVFIRYFVKHAPAGMSEARDRFLFRVLRRCYLSILGVALKYKGAVVALAIVFLVLGVGVFFKLPNGFLPEWDEGDIVFDYVLSPGISIERADEICRQAEEVIAGVPEVKMYIRKTGTHLGTPFAPANVGEIVILLDRNRKRSTFEIMDLLRDRVEKKVPELESDFHQMLTDRLGDLTGATKPIVVNLIGNDPVKLRNAAEAMKNTLEGIAGLNGVMIDLPPPQKEIRVSARQSEASLLGIGISDVYRYAQMALYGEVVSKLQHGLQTIPIRQFYTGDFRNKVKDIARIPIYTENGGVLPLGKLATFDMIEQNPEVHHKNGSIVININAEISGRPLGDVVRDIKNALYSAPSDSYTVELTGNYRDQQKSFTELLFVLFIAIVLIMALLLFIFESYKTALAVFLGTVCSASFVIFGLLVTGTEFDVSSFIGMITVMGIVVNNGILVIEFVERFRLKGMPLKEAITAAGSLRFRPVLITNLAAIAGFLPMALNIGGGGEILGPFSIAMISGLVGSMFFSLIVMPIVYSIIHKNSPERVM